jgi:mannitol/fructose-specific phosphotransferase system IIA component (Ntr-type)
MESKGYVRSGFSKNVLERENKSSTYVGKGITIPHSKEEFVIIPKICIISLKKPVYWQGNDIKIVIILALRFKDISTTKSFFKSFYNILDSDEAINKVLNAADSREIAKIFINGGNKSE